MIVTKGRLSRAQREQRWQRAVVIGGSIVIALIIGIVGYGYYDNQVRPFHRTLLEVGDKSIDTSYYIKMLRLYNIQGQADSSAAQLGLSNFVLQKMENDELHRQLAATLGLSATEEEIDARIEEMLDPSSNGNEESEVSAVTRDEYLDNLKSLGVSEAEFREVQRADILTEKVGDYIMERDVPSEMPQIHARGIQIRGDEDLVTVQTKLEEGEDFAVIAQEYSTDSGSKDSGGDLGWLPAGIMSETFDETVFALDVGIISEPIMEDDEGEFSRYWIIEVLEKEDSRPLDEDIRETLERSTYMDWLTQQREEIGIVNHIDQEMQDWAIKEALK